MTWLIYCQKIPSILFTVPVPESPHPHPYGFSVPTAAEITPVPFLVKAIRESNMGLLAGYAHESAHGAG